MLQLTSARRDYISPATVVVFKENAFTTLNRSYEHTQHKKRKRNEKLSYQAYEQCDVPTTNFYFIRPTTRNRKKSSRVFKRGV